MPHSDLRTLSDADIATMVVSAGPEAAHRAEAELCRRFAPRVRQYGLRHLTDAGSAADLVQRVLVLTLTKLRDGSVREPERIASFVLGASRTLCREIQRKAAREDPLPVDALAELATSTIIMPEPLPTDRLSGCMDALAERERTVVLLTFFHEQTSLEIAGALGLSEGNVRVIRHRAIERLRGCMGLAEEVV